MQGSKEVTAYIGCRDGLGFKMLVKFNLENAVEELMRDEFDCMRDKPALIDFIISIAVAVEEEDAEDGMGDIKIPTL
jgi:hypothetical protein